MTCFEAIKGIGVTTYATVQAFMPEPSHVKARVAKLAGLAPLNQDSGYDRLLVALTACSHKMLRILNAMARTGQPWSDEFHVAKA